MSRTIAYIILVLLVVLYLARSAQAIDVTASANGGGSPQTLAEMIADQAGGVNVVADSANTTINASGSPCSDAEAYGSFTNGMTPQGTLLPAANQNANGDAEYAGGIQINSGVCLCTGVLEDEPDTPMTGRGSGVLGPNNGKDNVSGFNAGEIVTVLGTPVDQDFEDLVFPAQTAGGGDATVVQFQVQISSPGFLRVSFVFGSDENPVYIDQFGVNDSVAIIIDGQCIDPENIATTTVNGVTTPFNLFDFEDCGLPLFIDNDVAPGPTPLPNTAHAIPGAPLYDIEFGGFTNRLTREISCPLAPGIYTVKFVVQDVGDQWIDAGVFLEENGLKLFPLAAGDYNGDGCVDGADYQVWVSNFGLTPATFYDGDGNGDCRVDAADYTVWRINLGHTGNTDCKGDFDRDGDVDLADYGIWNTYDGLGTCASRFEGDADGDGDVDNTDLTIWYGEWDFGCGCSGGGAAQSSPGGDSPASLQAQLPESPDVDGDGDVDEKDLEALKQIIFGTTAIEVSASSVDPPNDPESEPTLAEPQSEPGAPIDESWIDPTLAGDPPEFPVWPGPSPDMPPE